jgi:hypothetical protein
MHKHRQLGLYRRLGSLLVAGALLLIVSPTTHAQWMPGQRMTTAIARVMAAGQKVGNVSDYGYNEGVSILGGYVARGGSVSLSLSLDSGKSYLFVGGGDDNVRDLDISVSSPSGSEVERDDENDATPIVSFTAGRSGQYTVRLTHYSGSGPGFCALAILRKGGWDIPLRNLATAAALLIRFTGNVNQRVKENVTFHAQQNTWGLFGGVIPQGDSHELSMSMEAKRHVMVAAGDNNARDLDIYLFRTSSAILSMDEEVDAFPLIDYRTSSSRYTVRTKNARSSGASLILTAVLDLD